MRINPSLANEMYLNYMNSDSSSDSSSLDTSTSILPSGTYSKLAAAKYIKDNDKDNDGKLTSDEVTISDAAYAALDSDSDGYVTLKEMQSGLSGSDDEIYAYYASGGDTSSSEDVTTSILEGDDTTATKAEATYVKMAAKAYLADKDADDDGVVSLSESGLASNAFKQIDSNGNGSVTLSELQHALADEGDSIYTYYKNGGTAKLATLTSRLLATI